MTESKARHGRSGALLPYNRREPLFLGQNIEEDVKKINDRSGGSMRNRILLVAIALFAERGYENLSMRTLASWVGLKPSTLYNYHQSKQALLIDAIEFIMDDFFGFILNDIEATPRSRRLFEIIRRHASYKMTYQLLSRANDRLIDPGFTKMFLPEDAARHFIGRMTEYRHIVQDLIADQIKKDDPLDIRVATLSILIECDRMAYWYKPDGELSFDEALQQVVILACRILRKRPPPLSSFPRPG